MKKLLALFSLLVVFILAACGQTAKTESATTQAAATEEKSEVTLTKKM